MRIISFSKKWDKLKQAEFTTFRFLRADKDWAIGETVQVFYKSRSPQREKLGIAKIMKKEFRAMALHGDKTGLPHVTNEEVATDGFSDTEFKRGYFYMWEFLFDNYGGERLLREPMNKLTLRWLANQGGENDQARRTLPSLQN